MKGNLVNVFNHENLGFITKLNLTFDFLDFLSFLFLLVRYDFYFLHYFCFLN